MFVDYAKIYVKAGNGGHGAVSFHREKYVPNGGPDGGDGGDGGSIIFVVNEGMRTLMDFRHRRQYKADNGENGKARKSFGRNGRDLIIEVPPGTIIRDFETGNILADLYKADQPRVLIRGGRGGKGNTHFATATRQAPKFAKRGEEGPARELVLELKTIADVGLVGFPNVGKSTILSVITAARPKIANYHFTTITPNLGVVEQQGRSFVLADIPGLIEGAHEGVGLGHEFLRHVERTRMLVHVLDVSGSEGRDPIEDFHKVNYELEQYSAALAARPQIVAANKIDIPEAEDELLRLRQELEPQGIKVFPVSAAAHQGFNELIREIFDILDKLPPMEPFEEIEEPLFTQPDGDEFEILVEDGVYIVEGRGIERIIDSINFDDDDSLKYFQRVLRKKGIIDALRERGAQDGDTVRLGDVEFDFVD